MAAAKFYNNTMWTLQIINYKKNHMFAICPCANDIVYARFEDVKTFVYVFMNIV